MVASLQVPRMEAKGFFLVPPKLGSKDQIPQRMAELQMPVALW